MGHITPKTCRGLNLSWRKFQHRSSSLLAEETLWFRTFRRFYVPISGETLRFELIEDADHFFLDFFAEDAATLIAEFLAELPAETDELDLETANKELYENADLAYGEYLASECASCHHADASEGVPSIVGYEAWYTHLALIQYANGERNNAAMRLVARSLDDEQRIAVAAYFETQKTE